jgi:hypothetical protein
VTLSKARKTEPAENVITFLASLPPIKSAILLDGNGDGGQIKLEFSRDESTKILLLQHIYAGTAFKVTIEPEDSR